MEPKIIDSKVKENIGSHDISDSYEFCKVYVKSPAQLKKEEEQNEFEIRNKLVSSEYEYEFVNLSRIKVEHDDRTHEEIKARTHSLGIELTESDINTSDERESNKIDINPSHETVSDGNNYSPIEPEIQIYMNDPLYVEKEIFSTPVESAFEGKNINVQNNLIKHVSQCMKEEIVINDPEVKNHLQKNGDGSQTLCLYCGTTFSSLQYTEHLGTGCKKMDGSKSNVLTLQYFCDICEKKFTQKRYLTRHIALHSRRKPYVCNTCMKEFTRCYKLNEHIKQLHVVERPYLCDICKKAFTTNSKLKEHIRVHTNEKPYCCNVCVKAFRRQCDLNQHIIVHTGEKPYCCNICKKAYSQHFKLICHMKLHTGENLFPCTECNKKFTKQYLLNLHMRVHTGEKPYCCEVCGETFAQSNGLKQHTKAHTGEKPYICNICNKRFRQTSVLTAHMRVHTEEKPYVCDVCKKSFSRVSDLSVHKRSHIFKMSYCCNICSRYFSDKSNLSKHMRLHENIKLHE